MPIPVPTWEEKCPVWAQVENNCTSDCNQQSQNLFVQLQVLCMGRFGIVYQNIRRSYCTLVPKQYTFRATKGSLQVTTGLNLFSISGSAYSVESSFPYRNFTMFPRCEGPGNPNVGMERYDFQSQPTNRKKSVTNNGQCRFQ